MDIKTLRKLEEEKTSEGQSINRFWKQMKERKPDERKAGSSVVLMMKMMMTEDRADRDRALCVSSIEANVQSLTISVCLCLFSSSPALRLPRALN